MKVFGIIGWKNSGKTGLMERLVTEITVQGFSVSTIKHAHHTFDIDREGKDSFRHRAAGATEVLLCSQTRWALMHELKNNCEPGLGDLLERLSPVDLVLVEGFKKESYLKLETFRIENGKVPFARTNSDIIAIASDTVHSDLDLPVFDLNHTSDIATFILKQVKLL